MKLVLHSPHYTPLHLSRKMRELLLATGYVLIPYLVAAILVFAYQRQWFM
ncbi:MAG: hypothetical protein H6R19_481 [Proteobacteria bacterium]|nr:hypothetical protein [Pseudomonadota bacterium]